MLVFALPAENNQHSLHVSSQMYMGGNLVYADYMFNGYGTTKKDFVKQVHNNTSPPIYNDYAMGRLDPFFASTTLTYKLLILGKGY